MSVPANLVHRLLQQSPGGELVSPPFSEADLAFLNWDDPAQPPSAWERIRHSGIYGPGASGPFAWQSGPEWGVSPEGTEILNMNRGVIWTARRFSDINWNDPRIRLPEAYSAAAQPLPEVSYPSDSTATAAPAPPAGTSPYFTPTNYGGGYAPLEYTPGEPLDTPTDEFGRPVPVKQAGLFSNLPFSMPVMLALTAVGFLLFGRPKLPGPAPRYPRRRRARRR